MDPPPIETPRLHLRPTVALAGRRPALILLLACAVSHGCKKESSTSSSATPATAATPAFVKMPVERNVNAYLLDLAQRHKLDARIDGDWVVLSPSGAKINGGIG